MPNGESTTINVLNTPLARNWLQETILPGYAPNGVVQL
jgi:hypothetical protein